MTLLGSIPLNIDTFVSSAFEGETKDELLIETEANGTAHSARVRYFRDRAMVRVRFRVNR